MRDCEFLTVKTVWIRFWEYVADIKVQIKVKPEMFTYIDAKAGISGKFSRTFLGEDYCKPFKGLKRILIIPWEC